MTTHWTSWSQQRPHHEYMMMDSSSLMSYQARGPNQAPMQRSSLEPDYSMSPFNLAPMPQGPATHCQPHDGYNLHTYSPTESGPSLPQYNQYPSMRSGSGLATPDSGPDSSFEYPSGIDMAADARTTTRSPKAEPRGAAPKILGSKSSKPPKKVAPILAGNKEDRPIFNNGVNNLMKSIQEIGAKTRKDCRTETNQTGYPSPPMDQLKLGCGPKGTDTERNSKPYKCGFEGCEFAARQRAHLETHIRIHSGAKPYKCDEPGCDFASPQPGNLTNHKRTHTKEKPYKCDLCGQGFAQRGNIRPHIRGKHLGLKPFECRLDNCVNLEKFFVNRGNLKWHQNKFHEETLNVLVKRYDRIVHDIKDDRDLERLPQEDRKFMDYFTYCHPNSNKGIKGRGRRRATDGGSDSGCAKPANKKTKPTSSPKPPQQHHQKKLQQHAPPARNAYQSQPHAMLLNQCNVLPSSPSGILMNRDPSDGFGMFDMDPRSLPGVNTHGTTGGLYAEGRDLTFRQRMY